MKWSDHMWLGHIGPWWKISKTRWICRRLFSGDFSVSETESFIVLVVLPFQEGGNNLPISPVGERRHAQPFSWHQEEMRRERTHTLSPSCYREPFVTSPPYFHPSLSFWNWNFPCLGWEERIKQERIGHVGKFFAMTNTQVIWPHMKNLSKTTLVTVTLCSFFVLSLIISFLVHFRNWNFQEREIFLSGLYTRVVVVDDGRIGVTRPCRACGTPRFKGKSSHGDPKVRPMDHLCID